MVAEATARGKVLAVGHNYRSFPVNAKLKELLPQLGSVQRVLWQWLENRPESYYGRDIWRSTWRHAGGGVLMNQTATIWICCAGSLARRRKSRRLLATAGTGTK